MNDSFDETHLRSLLQDFHLPSGVESELYLARTKSRSVGWTDGKPSFRGSSATEGVCVRVLDKGREGLVTSRGADGDQIRFLATRALDLARLTPADSHRRFADAGAAYPAEVPADDRLFDRSVEESIEILRRLENQILSRDARLRKVVRLQLTEERETVGLANSRGVCLVGPGSATTFVVEAMGEDGAMADGAAAEGASTGGPSTEVAWDFSSRRLAQGFPFERIAADVAEHALQALGGKPIPSGEYPVVIDPRVGVQILSLVAQALSAEAVQLSRSFFRGALGRAVASAHVTLVDDPLLPDGLQSRAFDDEGTPHRPLALVKEGRLTDYFYDLRTAAREGRPSTGHGMKSALGAPPRPRHTNFYFEPGIDSREAILSSSPRVLLLRDVMGLHMADPISGEFSFGASGMLYENGRAMHAVRGITVAGTIGSLLEKISRVASDLTWRGDMGAPTFLVSSLSIGGR